MKMGRIVTAESESGVVVQASDLLESTSANLVTNIFDYQKKGIFGPKGSVRADVQSLPPETGNQAPDLGTGGGMKPGKERGGMPRTDSIDLAVVISGETDVAYPGEDGHMNEIPLKQGVIVQNGAFYEWRNRSGARSVIYIVLFGAERKTT